MCPLYSRKQETQRQPSWQKQEVSHIGCERPAADGLIALKSVTWLFLTILSQPIEWKLNILLLI